MKVPIQYKSSDRYNAGVDVIYDDDSKLQFAPFIYATTQSGDNGADEGGDEEGEETMILKYDTENQCYDKTWQEVKDASLAGKTVALIRDMSASGENPYSKFDLYYLTKIGVNDESTPVTYIAAFMGSYERSTVGEAPGTLIEHTVPIFLKADSASDYLKTVTIG